MSFQQLLNHSTNEECKLKMIPTGVKVFFLLFILNESLSLTQSDCLELLLFKQFPLQPGS